MPKRKLTNKELLEIALEVQSHTGLPFLDSITVKSIRIAQLIEIEEEQIENYIQNFINSCIILNHKFNKPNIKKCYDF